MYVYVPEFFRDDLSRYPGLEGERFKPLCDDLEKMTLPEARSRFEIIYPFLKRKEGNKRLIAEIRRLGDDFILCWMRVYSRGSNEYGIFLKDIEVGRHISDAELQTWLQNNQAQNSNFSSPKRLPSEYLKWLDRPSWKFDFNRNLVYESCWWLQGSQTAEFIAKKECFYQAIENLVSNKGDLGESTKILQIRLYSLNECFILYSKVEVGDDNCNSALMLITPFFSLPSSDQIKEVIERLTALDITEEYLTSCDNSDRLSTLAHRAYPDDILGEKDAWYALEENTEVNLALSTEERQILHDVSLQGNASLPLFLNGQAGSGKSTMLFYLFADYCYRYLEDKPVVITQPHPLFLAYNNKLVEIAHKQVKVILAAHHRFVTNGHSIPINTNIKPFFQRFRDLLRSVLPKDKKAKFKEENYISFYRFRQLLKKSNPSHSPERCWQVIRTFIKGYTLDERRDYLNTEDYKSDIPRSEKTVSQNEFENIYNTVWKWYKEYLKDRKLWDDQDLVREVLLFPGSLPKYTAIFCDEAQDFTRLELQAIMRLSVLSEYNLEYTTIASLPFAFAGDPLQTLNPTGFRWESLKANFYQEVISVLFPTDRSNHTNFKLNVRELECNYRSTKTIVCVNNLIQLWRKYLFDIKNLNPQKSRGFQGTEPQKFILDSNVSATEIQERLKGKIIIVPCDEGAEGEYIKKDAILSALYEANGETDKPAWNVLSAIAAKGLEFKQVVIYNFGAACPLKIWQPQDSVSEKDNYFFNKLYVAVSRATEQLLILDTQEGDCKLWSKASETQEIEAILNHITDLKKQEQWRSRICTIEVGELTTLDETKDLEGIARTLKKQGELDENADYLHRAAGAYRELGNERETLLCKALALQFEKELIAAGALFEQLEDWDKVLECYWEGQAWSKLQLIRDRLENITPLQEAIVQFMTNETLDWEAIAEFSQQLTQATENADAEAKILSSDQLNIAFRRYTKWVEITLKQPKSLQPQQWQLLGKTLQSLKDTDESKTVLLAVKCFYQGEDYPTTVSCAEANNLTQIREYYLAKAEVLEIPENLEFLIKAQEYNQVIQLWQKCNKPRDRVWLNSVAMACESLDKYKNALATYSWLDNLEKVKSCLGIIQSRFPNDFTQALQFTIQYYIDDGYWTEAIATLESHTELLNHPENTSFKQSIVKHIAESDLTPDTLNTDLRKRYEIFLKQQILEANWQQFIAMEYVGVTLEKTGLLVETLRFYEEFTASSQFAKERWLATKLRQAEYYQDSEKARKAEAKATQKAQEWQIALEDITIAPPDLTDVPVFAASAFSQPEIRNLPPDIIPEMRDRDRVDFQIDGLEIRLMRETQQVLIVDILTDTSLRIDGRSRQMQSQQFTLQYSQGEVLRFSDNQGKYRGVATFYPLQLELILPDRDRPLEILWR